MSTKLKPGPYGCYEKAEDDEPMFILLARDPQAPALVDLWASIRETEGNEDPGKIAEARRLAERMRIWRMNARP